MTIVPSHFAEGIARWETFYFAVGGIGATLAGLVFIATTLYFQRLQASDNVPLRAWTTYTVGHFAQVILIAVVFLVPDQTPLGLGVPLLLGAGFGLFTFARGLGYVIRTHQRLNGYSWLIYFILPGLLYLLMAASATAMVRSQTELLPLFVFVVLGLLLLGGHNCWNMILNQRVPGVNE